MTNAEVGGRHVVYPNAVPREITDDALRAINQHLVEHGMTVEQRVDWARTACWFPELADAPPLRAVHEYLPTAVTDWPEVWTQILLQFPQPPDTPNPEMHVDEPPPGKRFPAIAAVPLTLCSHVHGGIQFYERDLPLLPGDLVLFDGDVPHHGGVNRSPEIRYALYFRAVAPV